MKVVSELSKVKRAAGLRVRDVARERLILDDRSEHAERLGLSRELIESTFRVIMRASREYQAALKVEVPIPLEPKVIAIVGAEGAMGKRLADMFRTLGHQVLSADQHTQLTPIDAARQADVTLISVPIRATAEVIAQIGPHVPVAGLLMDVTSIKQAPLAEMLRATQASVLGTHPM